MARRLSGGEKAGLALGAGILTVLAIKGNAEAALPVGAGAQPVSNAPHIVPEANLPTAAWSWYDTALSNLGFAGTFQERLMGFQRTRMQGVLAPELSHLTPATQQAIQSAVGIATTGDYDTDDLPAGARRMRY